LHLNVFSKRIKGRYAFKNSLWHILPLSKVFLFLLFFFACASFWFLSILFLASLIVLEESLFWLHAVNLLSVILFIKNGESRCFSFEVVNIVDLVLLHCQAHRCFKVYMIPHDHILPSQCYFTVLLLEHFSPCPFPLPFFTFHMDGARHCLETEEL